MKSRRPYVMRARADAAAETRRRIMQALFELVYEKTSLEIHLDDVAGRAGVSVQTVLRHFGTREGLFEAAEEWARGEMHEERAAPVGDVDAAVRTIFDHYELRGDGVIRFLAQEIWDERLRRINDHGRGEHRRWVEAVFAPHLPAGGRDALVDLLVVATDVYTWKLLRRDRGLGRDEAEARVTQMIDALLPRRKEHL